MAIFSQLWQACRNHFSPKTPDTSVYKEIRHIHARKLVELGLGNGQRALRMIEVARKASPDEQIRYVGLDRFELRAAADSPGLSLIEAHQLLRGRGAKVQLVPGNPAEGLVRVANSLGKIDLLIVPAELDAEPFARMWFFVPRMLHERTLVFVEGRDENGERLIKLKLREEIDRQAALGAGRKAA